MCVTWNPLGRQHNGGIKSFTEGEPYEQEMAGGARVGRDSLLNHDADQTNEKGERKTGL